MAIQYTRDVVCKNGNNFTPSHIRQFSEQRTGQLTSDTGKGVAVEKEKRCTAVV